MSKPIDPNFRENVRLLSEFNLESMGRVYAWEGRAAFRAKVRFTATPIHATLAQVEEALLIRNKHLDNRKAQIEQSQSAGEKAKLTAGEITNLRIGITIAGHQIHKLKRMAQALKAATKRANEKGWGSLPPRPISVNVAGFHQSSEANYD